jgi:hypothetical protein
MVFLLLSTQHWNDNIVVELFSMAMGGTTTTTTASCGDSRVWRERERDERQV